MSSNWRAAILTADRTIASPKPSMPERCDRILASHFVKRYRYEGDQLVAVDLKQGEYPNRAQIRRVLEVEIPRLERLLQRTTKGHYLRSLRGARGRSWCGVAGPGHAWQIDSTIGDVYLRSSLNRAWIVGRRRQQCLGQRSRKPCLPQANRSPRDAGRFTRRRTSLCRRF